MVKKHSYIDALRGFAVLGVILVHCGQRVDGLAPWLKSITDEGARGVQLFFILSALTLFLSINQRSSQGELGSKEFFIRRFFRIAPLFYLAIIFYSARDILLHHFAQASYPEAFNSANFLSAFVFITNDFNPYWINGIVPGGWSITVEMTFYLFVPFLFKRVASLKVSLWITFITYVSSVLLNTIAKEALSSSIDESTLSGYLFFWFPNQIVVFCLGIVLYFLINNKTNEVNKKMASTGLVISILGLLSLSLINLPIEINHVAYSVSFVAVIGLLSKYEVKLLVNRITVFIGKISFSMYLTHIIVFQVVGIVAKKVSLSPILDLFLLFGSTVLITIAISYLTYRFIEKPCIKMGNDIISRNKKRILAESINKTA